VADPQSGRWLGAGIFSSFTGPMASTSAPIERVRTGIIGRLDSVRLGVDDSWDWWMLFDRIAGLTTAKKIVLLVGYTVGPVVGGVTR
jgi:hypothetical protein